MTIVHELRRKTKRGFSLYLDYTVNGRRIQERTGLFILNGKDTATREQNKKMEIRYKYLILERQKQLMDGVAALPMAIKRQKLNFFDYFNQYMELHPSKERRGVSTFKKLKSFHGADNLPVTLVTEEFLLKFKNYLQSILTGETPYDYFKYLKMVIKQATKDKLFLQNPALDIKVTRSAGIEKSSLTIEEIERLSAARCPNEMVKRAFLFSCYSGLRFCDIVMLRWANIDSCGLLSIVQVKTKYPLKTMLNQYALQMAGQRGNDEDLIFLMPTNAGTNKSLKVWAKEAGLQKHLTYHCARHSFATNVYDAVEDLLMTSHAMGHKSLKETPRYIKVSAQKVNNVVLSLRAPVM